MRNIFTFAAICMTAALIGCATTHDAVSPGAISACGAKEGQACTKAKSECCGAAKCDGDKAAMGAVSECATKAECASKAECTTKKAECHHEKVCPATGAKGSECSQSEASLGAVSECGVKAECTKSKSECTTAKTCTSLGAVSEKRGCSAKATCGSRN